MPAQKLRPRNCCFVEMLLPGPTITSRRAGPVVKHQMLTKHFNQLGPEKMAAANKQKLKHTKWSSAESSPRELQQPHWGKSLFPACPQARFLWMHKGWNCSFFSDTLEGAQYGRLQVSVQRTSSFIRLLLSTALLPDPTQSCLPGMWYLPSHRVSCTYTWNSFQRS